MNGRIHGALLGNCKETPSGTGCTAEVCWNHHYLVRITFLQHKIAICTVKYEKEVQASTHLDITAFFISCE